MVGSFLPPPLPSNVTISPLLEGPRGPRADFYANCIATASYGVYVVLSTMHIKLLLNRSRKVRQRVSSCYSLIMFGITTTWFIINTYTYESDSVEAWFRNSVSAVPNVQYCSRTDIASVALSAFQIIGSDVLLTYRTYVIWDRDIRVILVPLVASLSFIGVAIAGNLTCTSLLKDQQTISRLVIAYYCFPVACNAACTIAICVKILWHQRTLRENNITSHAEYNFMMAVVAESGFFYAVAGIVNIIFTTRNHPYKSVTNAVFTALVYITPAQIILRIALGVDIKSTLNRWKTPMLSRSGIDFAVHNTGAHTTGFDHHVASMLINELVISGSSQSPEPSQDRNRPSSEFIVQVDRYPATTALQPVCDLDCPCGLCTRIALHNSG